MIPIHSLQQRLIEHEISDIKSFDVRIEEDTIQEQFEMFYELEFKYQAFMHREFVGNPTRRDNLVKILEEKSKEVIKAIAKTFVDVYGEWLKSHALTDPKKWAQERVKSYEQSVEEGGEDYSIQNTIIEYIRYKFGVHSGNDTNRIRVAFSEIMRDVMKNISKYPDFKKYCEEILIPMEREDRLNRLGDEGLEEFNDAYGKKFKTEEEADDWISKVTLKDIDISDSLYILFEDDYQRMAEEMRGYLSGFLISVNQYLVFPFWYKFWKAKGIDRTREKIQKVYDSLKKIASEPVGEQFVTLNLAITQTHQTGDMLDYYEQKWQDIDKRFLQSLTDQNTEEWTKDLIGIGVKII